MKKSFFAIFFTFISIFCFSQQGILWNSSPLKTVQTKWFDIIYPQDSEDSAKLLYKNADSIYEEVAASYGLEPSVRMPIVLTPNVESFNAYWSNGYYNHIVLYDTAGSEELEVFSEDLLSTFRHEVTHAFTYNMKNKFWKIVGNIFGDGISLQGILTTSGWAEGATLTSESSNGEGRLNNEYAKHLVKQAKIEGIFPSYSDVQGARDIYPFGDYYYFNGAFNLWLQKKYGMEKYAQMWFNLVNPKTIFINSAFKKVYGINLDSAWQKFYDDYEIPEVYENPVEENIVQDFFKPNKNKYSEKNNAGSLYQSLSKSSKGIYYLDEKSENLYFSPISDFSKIKQKKVLVLANVQNAVSSSDGRFVALTYYNINDSNIKLKSAIYDTSRKNIFYFHENGLKENSIIKNGDDYFLVSLKFHSQKKEIYIQKIEIEKNKIKKLNFVTSIPLSENNSANSFTDIGNGKFAFINKDKLEWSIKIADLNGKIEANYVLPYEKMVIKNLSYSEDELLFSFTTESQMPKLGKLSLNKNEYFLWNKNLSGGIFYPVKDSGKIIYIGKFYNQNRIFSKNESEIYYDILPAQNKLDDSFEKKLEPKDDNFKLPSETYKFSRYLLKGTFLPLSVMESNSYDYEHLNGNYSMPLGFTFLSRNPWDSSTILFSLGYGVQTNSFGARLYYMSGTSTSLLNYGFDTSFEFDKLGFKQTNSSVQIGCGFRVGDYSSLSINGNGFLHYGRSNVNVIDGAMNYLENGLFECGFDENSKNYLYNSDSVQLQFSNVHKTGPGKFEKIGFSSAIVLSYLNYEYSKNIENACFNIFDVGFAFNFFIPKIILIENVQGMTFNLPIILSANLFTSPAKKSSMFDSFPTYSMASFGVEVILFQKEIQKAFSLIPNFLYFNEIRFSANYHGGFDYENDCFFDNWKITKMKNYISMIKNKELLYYGYPYLNLMLGLTPNMGASANSSNKIFLYFTFGVIPDKDSYQIGKRYIPVFDFSTSISF